MIYKIQDVMRVKAGDIWENAAKQRFMVIDTVPEYIEVCSEITSKQEFIHFQDFYRLYYFVK